MLEIQNKEEKIYLIVLVISAIIITFIIIYIWNKCPNCNETYSLKSNKPVIVYKLG
jgi:hypothetical protein